MAYAPEPSPRDRGAEKWVSVRVDPGANRDGVVAALFAVGAQGVQELGEQLVTLLSANTPADAVTRAVLAASPHARIDMVATPVLDWSEHWRDGIRAQELGRLVIAPPWLAASFDADRTIVIEPGMAFGTGDHPTTRGVVRLLPGLIRAGDRVADLGAGSAVLAIAAAKLGAAWVAAIELDRDAIGNAQANIDRNGVGHRVTVVEGDAAVLLPLLAPVRVVLANIVSSVILRLLPIMAAALEPGGEAILSGMLREEREQMLDALERGGWHVTTEDHEDIWWSVAIARR